MLKNPFVFFFLNNSNTTQPNNMKTSPDILRETCYRSEMPKMIWHWAWTYYNSNESKWEQIPHLTKKSTSNKQMVCKKYLVLFKGLNIMLIHVNIQHFAFSSCKKYFLFLVHKNIDKNICLRFLQIFLVPINLFF